MAHRPVKVQPGAHSSDVNVGPVPGADALYDIKSWNKAMADIAAGHHYITGYVSFVENPSDTTYLESAALEFGSPAEAAAAAAELNTRHHAGVLHVRTLTAPLSVHGFTGSAGKTNIASEFLASGPLVLWEQVLTRSASHPPDKRLATTALKAQRAAFATLRRISPDQLMNQPCDPEGLLSRTLPVSGSFGS